MPPIFETRTKVQSDPMQETRQGCVPSFCPELHGQIEDTCNVCGPSLEYVGRQRPLYFIIGTGAIVYASARGAWIVGGPRSCMRRPFDSYSASPQLALRTRQVCHC